MPWARVAVCFVVTVAAVVATGRGARALASLTVDTFDDTYDGSCADVDCSLRDAIADVDTGGVVRVPAGYYALTLSGSGDVASGDLDVDREITVVGTGETGAFLDAFGLGDRAFDLTAPVSLRHLTLLGGSDVGGGGVVRVGAGSSRLSLVTIRGGRASDGGAVAVGDGAAVRIERSWLSANRATGRGGGLLVHGSATVVRTTLSGNRAGSGGGAWVGPDGDLTIGDTTLSGNAADRGGGGVRVHGTLSLRSATVARNRAAVGGGVMVSAAAHVTVMSSVFGGNDGSVRGPTCSRRLSSRGHNVADAGGCGLTRDSDIRGNDPLLGILRQNGGPTPTHALAAGSPAIDHGTGCVDVDQRGAPRRRCDSGAYELVLCLGRPVTIVGTPGPDDLSGGLGRDVFLGRGGDDHFQGSLDDDRACGGTGDDRLIGGPGDDRLAGNAGDDALVGEGGDDLLVGGPGTDVCRGDGGLDLARRCEIAS